MASASAITPAVTPEPQEATTGLPVSTPAAAKIRASSGCRLQRAVGIEQRGEGHVARARDVAGAQARRGSGTRALEAAGGAGIDDLRGRAADQRLDVGRRRARARR